MYSGWPEQATALVERAIAAHGGRPGWLGVECIRLPFQSGRGLLLSLKGFGTTFAAPREIDVFPHTRTTVFHGYPDGTHRGRFVDGAVSLERVADNAVVAESRDHRRTFAGLAKFRRWQPLDALYFFGYALWHYHVVPFTLGEARLVRVLADRGQPAGVDVVFSETVPTHSRRQQFYFGPDGRVVRHDYVADVVGPFARGAHLWEDVVQTGGLLVSRRRRVVVRVGRHVTPVPVLDVRFGPPAVHAKSS